MRRLLRAAALLAAVLVALPRASAQVDALFTQYYEVPGYYNPGATGTTDYLRIRAGSRLQWVGIPKAPVTFAAAADMPFKLGKRRIGAGLVLQQESMGLYSSMILGAQGSVKFPLLGGVLSAGIRVGFVDESFKGSEVILPDGDDYHQGTDEGIPMTDIHGTGFDMGLGVWYTRGPWWGGLSLTHANSPTVTLTADNSQSADNEYEFRAGRIAYFTAGGNIPVKNTLFELQPSIMVASDFTTTSAQLTARARYNRLFTAGLAYRWRDAVSLLLGVEIRDFYLGYAYDYPVTALRSASSGSHEIWGGYRLKVDLGEKNRHRHKSIRIM